MILRQPCFVSPEVTSLHECEGAAAEDVKANSVSSWINTIADRFSVMVVVALKNAEEMVKDQARSPRPLGQTWRVRMKRWRSMGVDSHEREGQNFSDLHSDSGFFLPGSDIVPTGAPPVSSMLLLQRITRSSRSRPSLHQMAWKQRILRRTSEQRKVWIGVVPDVDRLSEVTEHENKGQIAQQHSNTMHARGDPNQVQNTSTQPSSHRILTWSATVMRRE